MTLNAKIIVSFKQELFHIAKLLLSAFNLTCVEDAPECLNCCPAEKMCGKGLELDFKGLAVPVMLAGGGTGWR